MRLVFFGSIFFSLLILGCVSKPISSYTSENTKINSDVQTHAIDSIALPYRNQMQAEMAEVIGYSDSTLLSYAPESPLGNFVADVIFEAGFDFAKNNRICDNPHAAFSILNFGGLRKPIGQGEITRSDIYELMPFDNAIVIVKIEASKMNSIVDYMETMNGQPVSNVSFVFGQGLRGFVVGKNTTEKVDSYYIITSDYLSGGGDKMDFLKEPVQIWNTGILIRDALITFIQNKKVIPFTPVQNRMYFP
ncbi:MAG: 5'-nucleotidase C-terminal domain-containing protein [Crocinitomicaceae bacterium]|nr:5'-nucleotidase C-terminal domain-containing protein [Crocinitomicaceae bacterium]